MERLYIALDVNDTTYFNVGGPEIPRFSTHATWEEYDAMKNNWLKMADGPSIAEAASQFVTLIKPEGKLPNGEVLGPPVNAKRPLLDKVRALTFDSNQRVFLGKDLAEYELNPDIQSGLYYALVRGVRVVLNTAAKATDTNAGGLLTKIYEDGILKLLNQDFALAMRPEEVLVSTPASKGSCVIGIEHGLGAQAIILENGPEGTEVARALGKDVAVIGSKAETNAFRINDPPDFIVTDLISPQAGIIIYEANMIDLIDWRLGIGGEIKSLPGGDKGEYVFVRPIKLFPAAKPDAPEVFAK